MITYIQGGVRMDDVRNSLRDEWNERMEEFTDLKPSDPEYEAAGKIVLDMYDRLLKTEELEQKVADMNDGRVLEAEKLEQQKVENRRNTILRSIGVGASVGLTFMMMNFEKFGTFTTQVGRNLISGIVRNFKINL